MLAGRAIAALRQQQLLAVDHGPLQIQLAELRFQRQVQWAEVDRLDLPVTQPATSPAQGRRAGAERQQAGIGEQEQRLEVRLQALALRRIARQATRQQRQLAQPEALRTVLL